MNPTIHKVWLRSKTWHAIPLGPVSIRYRLARNVHVSNNRKRRMVQAFRGIFPTKAGQTQPGHTSSPQGSSDRSREIAVIVGVGPGLGYALARKLSAKGMRLALVSRNAERLDPLAAELNAAGGCAVAYGCDSADERSVQSLMPLLVRDLGVPNLVVYSVQDFPAGRVIDTEVAAFEEAWRNNCLGAFIVARESARLMAPLHRGTIVFAGATSGVIGRAGYANLAVGKFGLRALSQAMAREMWSQGLHIVHLIIDAGIEEEAVPPPNVPRTMYPDDLAETIYFVHSQPRSAWTLELDARPWDEAFWEHC